MTDPPCRCSIEVVESGEGVNFIGVTAPPQTKSLDTSWPYVVGDVSSSLTNDRRTSQVLDDTTAMNLKGSDHGRP